MWWSFLIIQKQSNYLHTEDYSSWKSQFLILSFNWIGCVGFNLCWFIHELSTCRFNMIDVMSLKKLKSTLDSQMSNCNVITETWPVMPPTEFRQNGRESGWWTLIKKMKTAVLLQSYLLFSWLIYLLWHFIIKGEIRWRSDSKTNQNKYCFSTLSKRTRPN